MCSFRLKIGVAEVYVCINIIWSYINIKIYDLAVIYVCVYMLSADILTHKINVMATTMVRVGHQHNFITFVVNDLCQPSCFSVARTTSHVGVTLPARPAPRHPSFLVESLKREGLYANSPVKPHRCVLSSPRIYFTTTFLTHCFI